MKRRQFMLLIAAAPLVMAVTGRSRPAWSAEAKGDKSLDGIRKNWKSLLARDAKVRECKGHLDTKKDFKLFLSRTEYHCIRCDGHHGHVFDDGPAPARRQPSNYLVY